MRIKPYPIRSPIDSPLLPDADEELDAILTRQGIQRSSRTTMSPKLHIATVVPSLCTDWRPCEQEIAQVGVAQEEHPPPEVTMTRIAAKVNLDDLSLGQLFIAKSIQWNGRLSRIVPTQKEMQRMGLTTTKQQKARDVLREIGVIVITSRTELSPRFNSLMQAQKFLESMPR
jgi:hypothetical protein